MRKLICVGVIGGLLEFGIVYQFAFTGADAAARETSSPEGKQIASARGAAPGGRHVKLTGSGDSVPVPPPAGATTAVHDSPPAPPAPAPVSPPEPERPPQPELTPEQQKEQDREIRAQRALARLEAREQEAAEGARLAEERKLAAERKVAAAREAEAARKAAAERKAAQEDLSQAASTVAAKAVVAPFTPPAPGEPAPVQLAQVQAPPAPDEPPPVNLASLTIEELIRHVFGPEGEKAIQVAWCESTMRPHAQRGQFLGLFQLGEAERADYGHGPDAVAQVLAAYSLFLDRGWQPWACA